MIVQANLGPHRWKSPVGHGAFRPNGKVIQIGRLPVYMQNAKAWSAKGGARGGMLAARLFVGFNVGGEPRWSIDDVVPIVTAVRAEQGKLKDASFLLQKGVYTSRVSGDTIVEDSAQVIVLNVDHDAKAKFTAQMVALAERLARELKQEEVIVEIQRSGITAETFGVTP